MAHRLKRRYAYTTRDARAYGIFLSAVVGSFLAWYVADYMLP